MFSYLPLEASPSLGLAIVMAILALFDVTGRMLIYAQLRNSWSIQSLALTLPVGLITWIGIAATVGLGRANYLTLLPVLFVGLRFYRPIETTPPDNGTTAWPDWLVALGTLLFSSLLMNYVQWGGEHNGKFYLPNQDLSYFALLAQEIPKAGVASQWASTLGAQTQHAGVSADIWYHWGPVWLTSLVYRVTSLGTMDALLKIVAPTLHFLMIVCLSSVIGAVTQIAPRRSLPVAALALIAMSWPAISLIVTLYRLVGHDLEPYVHWNVTYQFSYKFEAVLVFATLAAWLNRQNLLAALLLFSAGVSAPHNVAGLILALGTVAAFGLIKRDQFLLATGSIGTGLMFLGWATVKLFGVGLPKADNSSMIVTGTSEWLHRLPLLGKDYLVGIAFVALLLPGAIYLTRSDQIKDERQRLLGWLIIGALTACYPAYRFLLPTGEHGHFTNYAHAVIIFPLAFIGLIAAALQSPAKWIRQLCAVLMFSTVMIGAWDMVTDHGYSENNLAKFSAADLSRVREIVNGERIGFFAKTDRHWWIPANSSITAFVGSPCVRLNVIPKIDEDAVLGSFYGSQVPYALVPKQADETPLAWSLRYATALDVHYLMETQGCELPDELRTKAKLEFEAPGLKLFTLTSPPP